MSKKNISGENKSNSVNLSREFSLLSEKIMAIDLQKKEHCDAFEFLEHLIDFIISENPLSDEYFIYPYFGFITCLSCKSTVGEVISHKKNIVLPIPEQDDSITLESLLYAKRFCSLKEEDERTRCNSGCSGKMKPLFLEVHQKYLLFVLLLIPLQQCTAKPQLRCLIVFI